MRKSSCLSCIWHSDNLFLRPFDKELKRNHRTPKLPILYCKHSLMLLIPEKDCELFSLFNDVTVAKEEEGKVRQIGEW